jgi:hypothetical protein
VPAATSADSATSEGGAGLADQVALLAGLLVVDVRRVVAVGHAADRRRVARGGPVDGVAGHVERAVLHQPVRGGEPGRGGALRQGEHRGRVRRPVDEGHLDDLPADDAAAGRGGVLHDDRPADPDRVALQDTGLDLLHRARVDDERLEEPVVAGLLERQADTGGGRGVLLADVAPDHPGGHRRLQPLRVADLLVEVEVRAGGLAPHAQRAVVVLLRLQDRQEGHRVTPR